MSEATNNKKIPAERQLDGDQNDIHVGAGVEKESTPPPGMPGSVLDWAECRACYAVRTVSVNWYGNELKCRHCGHATRHNVLFLDGIEQRCEFYLGCLIAAAVSVRAVEGLTGDSGRPSLFQVRAYLTGAQPEFQVAIANNLTPWGLLRALKYANQWVVDADLWTPWTAYGWSTLKDGRRYRAWTMGIRPTDRDPVPGAEEFRKRVYEHD